jgi:Tfp pilus assembly protein PilN
LIRINLLPIRAFKRRENIRLQISSFLLSVVVVVLLLGGFYFNRSQILDEQLVTKEKVKKRWEAQLAKETVLEIQKETMDVLERRINLIIDLIIQRSGPVRLLDEIINSTPNNEIWLTEVNQTKEKIKVTVMVPEKSRKEPAKKAGQKPAEDQSLSRKAQVKEKITTKSADTKQTTKMVPKTEDKIVDVLTLKGVAKDNQVLAKYIETLEASPILEEVQLENSRQTLINNLRLKNFSLKCVIDYLVAEKGKDSEQRAEVAGGRRK